MALQNFGADPKHALLALENEIKRALKNEVKGALIGELEPAAAALLEIEGELTALARELVHQVAERVAHEVIQAAVMRMERVQNIYDFREALHVHVRFDKPIYVVEKQPPLVPDYQPRLKELEMPAGMRELQRQMDALAERQMRAALRPPWEEKAQ